MLLERRCHGCGWPGAPVCERCLDQLVPAPEGAVHGGGEAVGGVVSCASMFAFEGPGRALVVALKYRNRRSLGRLLGTAMAALVDPGPIQVVTWAPTSRARRHRRGYDQSRLLAQGMADQLGRPCQSLLRRRAGPAQTGRTLAERRVGPRFEPVGRCHGVVLVVDDVVTTGATLAAAARALHRAGASQVQAVTAASTASRAASGPPGFAASP